MIIEECISVLSDFFEITKQEKWDNSGAQILHSKEKIKGILCSLDCTSSVIDEAIVRECNLIVTHHPLFFDGVKSINTGTEKGSRIQQLISDGISLFSLHTCLDKKYWMNAASVFDVPFEGPVFTDTDDCNGYGVLLKFKTEISVEHLCAIIKKNFYADFVRVTVQQNQHIKRVVFLPGSGGSFIDEVLAGGKADCIVTGDVSYHRAVDAIAAGVVLVDAGHFFTEKNYLAFLRNDISKCIGNDIQVIVAETEKSPFRLC